MLTEVSISDFRNYTQKRLGHWDYNYGGWYLIVRKSDQKSYVGKSIEILHRLRQHISKKNPKTHIDKCINNDGAEQFKYFIIDTYKNYDIDFFNRSLETVIENELIRDYKTFQPHGLNICYYERI